MFKAVQLDYRMRAGEDLDKGRLWMFKVFTLLPILAKLTNADHYARVLFPIAFGIFLITAFSEVDFFSSHYSLLETSNCYNAGI